MSKLSSRVPSRLRDLLPRVLPIVALILVVVVLTPAVASAAPVGGGADMPWTGPLQSLLDNLSGTTARILGALVSEYIRTAEPVGSARLAQSAPDVRGSPHEIPQ